MRKILGSRDKYYVQTNNAQVELFKDYFKNGKMIACGPESAAMGFHIAGRDMSIFTPGEQPGDSILMIMHNPLNLERFKKRRDLNYNEYPPNEVPQGYDVVGEILYGPGTCKFKWGLNYDIIKQNINTGIPMMICGKFSCGGHYVLVVGYDEEKKVPVYNKKNKLEGYENQKMIIFNDPYPFQWVDKKGYNREMDMQFFNEKISKYRVDFMPCKGNV